MESLESGKQILIPYLLSLVTGYSFDSGIIADGAIVRRAPTTDYRPPTTLYRSGIIADGAIVRRAPTTDYRPPTTLYRSGIIAGDTSAKRP